MKGNRRAEICGKPDKERHYAAFMSLKCCTAAPADPTAHTDLTGKVNIRVWEASDSKTTQNNPVYLPVPEVMQ